jgi:hypothetical protein
MKQCMQRAVNSSLWLSGSFIICEYNFGASRAMGFNFNEPKIGPTAGDKHNSMELI